MTNAPAGSAGADRNRRRAILSIALNGVPIVGAAINGAGCGRVSARSVRGDGDCVSACDRAALWKRLPWSRSELSTFGVLPGDRPVIVPNHFSGDDRQIYRWAKPLICLVGAARFELATPSPPDWCANRAALRSADRLEADDLRPRARARKVVGRMRVVAAISPERTRDQELVAPVVRCR